MEVERTNVLSAGLSSTTYRSTCIRVVDTGMHSWSAPQDTGRPVGGCQYLGTLSRSPHQGVGRCGHL